MTGQGCSHGPPIWQPGPPTAEPGPTNQNEFFPTNGLYCRQTFVRIEHFWAFFFQLMKRGTNTLYVAFTFLLSIFHWVHFNTIFSSEENNMFSPHMWKSHFHVWNSKFARENLTLTRDRIKTLKRENRMCSFATFICENLTNMWICKFYTWTWNSVILTFEKVMLLTCCISNVELKTLYFHSVKR